MITLSIPGMTLDSNGTVNGTLPYSLNGTDAVLQADYNYLTATARFQVLRAEGRLFPGTNAPGESPYASCGAGVQGALVSALSGALGFPAGNISTACSADSSAGAARRLRRSLEDVTCVAAVKTDITFKMDPAIAVDGFRAAVYSALSDGGIAGVCPLGLLAGGWAVAGAAIRAIAPTGGAIPSCQAFSAIVAAALQAAGSAGAAATASGCTTSTYFGTLAAGGVDGGGGGAVDGGGGTSDGKGGPAVIPIIVGVVGAVLLAGLLAAAFVWWHRKQAAAAGAAGAAGAVGLELASSAAGDGGMAMAAAVAGVGAGAGAAGAAGARAWQEGRGADAAAAAGGAAGAAAGAAVHPRHFNRPGDASSGTDPEDASVAGAGVAAAAKLAGASGRSLRHFLRPDGRGTSGEMEAEAGAPHAVAGAAAAAASGAGLAPHLRDYRRAEGGAHGGELDPEAAAGGQAAAAAAAAGPLGTHARQLKYAEVGDGAVAWDVEEEAMAAAPRRLRLPDNATEEERRLHALHHSSRGPTEGDDAIGPVDAIQLQRELRRKAMLDKMKND
ncbi:hypothetical protein TSOC_004285, partial [Tetrabaena socialis]